MNRPPTPNILAGLATPARPDDLALAIGPQAQRISTAVIRLDGGTQPRTGIDSATVDAYYSDMQAGAEFPPVELIYDGTDYWLWDGFHRLHAWRRDGDRAIPAHVRQGTRRDAVLHSVGANATHGLRRSDADKRRAVETLLTDSEWTQWSDREIARRCNVSPTYVGTVRASLAPAPTVHVDSSQRLYSRNGHTQRMDTARIGQRPADPPAPPPPTEPTDELLNSLMVWSDAYEDGDDALQNLLDEALADRGGFVMDDWRAWATVRWTKPALIKTLRLILLQHDDEDDDATPATPLWEPPNSAVVGETIAPAAAAGQPVIIDHGMLTIQIDPTTVRISTIVPVRLTIPEWDRLVSQVNRILAEAAQ